MTNTANVDLSTFTKIIEHFYGVPELQFKEDLDNWFKIEYLNKLTLVRLEQPRSI